jgi:16S rRNA (adenine1518-N6/adenine1519-N6)-dimethyltransferase
MIAKKSLGQNFLMHRQTAERIVEAAGVTENDTILEIGPGTGMLTRALLAKAGKVIAVEADTELLRELEITFAAEIEEGKLELVSSDIRAFSPNIETLGNSYSIVANIPYYITGELFRKFLTAEHKPQNLTFLVQKEVAVRITRSKKESLLSLSVKAFGTPTYCFTVPKGAFFPAPKVDSAVISITNIHSPFASKSDEERFFEILHLGFGQKRKQLVNNLSEKFTDASILKSFNSLDISPKVRAEDLKLDTWLVLTPLLMVV